MVFIESIMRKIDVRLSNFRLAEEIPDHVAIVLSLRLLSTKEEYEDYCRNIIDIENGLMTLWRRDVEDDAKNIVFTPEYREEQLIKYELPPSTTDEELRMKVAAGEYWQKRVMGAMNRLLTDEDYCYTIARLLVSTFPTLRNAGIVRLDTEAQMGFIKLDISDLSNLLISLINILFSVEEEGVSKPEVVKEVPVAAIPEPVSTPVPARSPATVEMPIVYNTVGYSPTPITTKGAVLANQDDPFDI